MPLYATEQDYRDWSGDQSVQISQRTLDRASRLIVLSTAGAWYATSSGTDLPTDPAVLAALKEATLEVLDVRATEEASGVGELAGVQSASIGSVSFTLAAGTQVEKSSDLPVEAYRVLQSAGLLGGPVVVYG